MEICGKIVDVFNKKIFPGCIKINDGKITAIYSKNNASNFFILPGFIDSHVHIESSMLTPLQFSKLALKHGTVAVVTDPHEIANVLGEKGINFMFKDSEHTPLKIYYGLPSCVPATPFETSGAIIDAKKTKELFKKYDFKVLSEVMNYPGVINRENDIMEKIKIAKENKKRIDGHAPGLRGKELDLYISAGIETDHEAFEYDEAKEKIQKGMKIIIREGSAAKNLNNLFKLINEYPDDVMLCTDDAHPDDLMKGHINKIISQAIKLGAEFFNVLKAATINPVQFYNLNVGLLRVNDPADFIIVKNIENFDVISTYIEGKLVYSDNQYHINTHIVTKSINNFHAEKISKNDLIVKPVKGKKIKIIKAFDGQLITDTFIYTPKIINNNIVSDTKTDILKIIVLNRYKKAKPSIGFIHGFGIKKGAIAQTIAHDSHNIIAIGVDDEDILIAVNKLIEQKGGIVVFDGDQIYNLPLEIAGLMSYAEPEVVAKKYEFLNNIVINKLGSSMKAPFMTLSFMALLVIPKLKIGDKGLFDVNKFKFTDLYV